MTTPRMPLTIAELLDSAIAPDPTLPVLTYYDRPTGERTELSGATFANWVAKSANFLSDDLDVTHTDTVALALPPHWQTAAIELACWLLGAAVTDRAWESPQPVDLIITSEQRMMELADLPARDIVVTALHPLGLGVSAKPDHVVDYGIEVRAHGDTFASRGPIEPDEIGLYAESFHLTHEALTLGAHAAAERLGLRAGDRIVLTVDLAQEVGPLIWLLAPLAARASIVLIKVEPSADANQWLRSIATQERVTASLGVDLPEDLESGVRQIPTG